LISPINIMDANFFRKIEEIANKDSRYKPDAYEFVMQALWFTQKKLKQSGHVSGRQLLDGIRKFAIRQYGPMAKTVFGHWGVRVTADFGEIVFNMVDAGLMRSTEEDKKSDFEDVYDFDVALNVFRAEKRKAQRSEKVLENEKENLLS